MMNEKKSSSNMASVNWKQVNGSEQLRLVTELNISTSYGHVTSQVTAHVA